MMTSIVIRLSFRPLRANYLLQFAARFALLPLLCLSGVCLTAAQEAGGGHNEQARPLVPGAVVEREINGGEVHTYSLALEANQCVKIITEPRRNADFTLTLLGPDGSSIPAENNKGNQRVEPIFWLNERAGVYQLQISCPRANAPAGGYALRLEIFAPDEKRQLAFEKFAAALRLRQQGKEAWPAAVNNFAETLELWRSLADSEAEAITLHHLGLLQLKMGNGPKAIEYETQALSLFRALNRKADEALVLADLSEAYLTGGNYLKGSEYSELAIALAAYLSRSELASAYYNNGVAWQGLSKNQKALESFQTALSAFRAAGNQDGELIALSDIGRQYYAVGEAIKSLEYANQGLALSREYKMPIREARFAQDIGRVYVSIGDDDSALEYCQEALKLFRAAKYVGGETAVLILLGDIHRSLEDFAAALADYNQAAQLARENKLSEAAARTASRLGAVYTARGEYATALEHLQQALTFFRATGNRRSEINALLGLGRTYAKMEDRSRAGEMLREALKVSRESADGFAESHILNELAQVARDGGDLDGARRTIEEAIRKSDAERNKLIAPSLSAAFAGTTHELYKTYADVLLRQHALSPKAGYDALALQVAEQARARSLLELLAESRVDLRQDGDAALLRKQQALKEQLAARDAASHQSFARPTDGGTKEHGSSATEITELTSQLQIIEAQIRQANPRYVLLTQPPVLAVADMQRQLLDSETALLEFSLGQKSSTLWVVTADALSTFTLPGTGKITAATRRLLELLPRGTQRKYRRETELAAEELSNLILKPAAASLNRKRLLVVADGPLQFVPFAALPVPESPVPDFAGAARETLLTRHEIISLPSASVLAALRAEMQERRPAEKQLAIFSDPVFQPNDPRVLLAKGANDGGGSARPTATQTAGPPPAATLLATRAVTRAITRAGAEAGLMKFERLPFAHQEAEAISGLLPKQGQLRAFDFTASRATALAQPLGEYRLIHFATHGMINSRHPDLSGVVLSLVDEDGRPQDGFLRLNDLYNLRLNADVVVLSACRTALGKDIRDEGLIGLTRGFMYAGAKRVVASLWDVNDAATAELMKKFYQGMLVEKRSPAAALRSAQLAMAADARWSAPYYWSGFVLQGEWR